MQEAKRRLEEAAEGGGERGSAEKRGSAGAGGLEGEGQEIRGETFFHTIGQQKNKTPPGLGAGESVQRKEEGVRLPVGLPVTALAATA